MKRLASIPSAIALAVLVGAGASAAANAAVSLRVRPATVSPGAVVRVSGNAGDCPTADTVTVISRAFRGHAFAGLGAISARVRAGGAFVGSGRVRRYAPAGRYTVTARCGGGNLGVRAFLHVR